MKNIIKIASALMGAVLFMAQPIASNAAANGNIDENIVKVPEIGIEVNVPAQYDFLFDRQRSYRKNIDEYGISSEKLMNSLRNNDTYVDAVMLKRDCYYEASISSITVSSQANINMLTDEEIEEIAQDLASSATSYGASKNDVTTFDQVCTINGNKYMGLSTTYTDDGEVISVYSLSTMFHGRSYYFNVKSDKQGVGMGELRKYSEELIKGTTFTNLASGAPGYSGGSQPAPAQGSGSPEDVDQAVNNTDTYETYQDISSQQTIDMNAFFNSRPGIGQSDDELFSNPYYWAGRIFFGAVFVIIVAVVVKVVISNKKPQTILQSTGWYDEQSANNNTYYNGQQMNNNTFYNDQQMNNNGYYNDQQINNNYYNDQQANNNYYNEHPANNNNYYNGQQPDNNYYNDQQMNNNNNNNYYG